MNKETEIDSNYTRINFTIKATPNDLHITIDMKAKETANGEPQEIASIISIRFSAK